MESVYWVMTWLCHRTCKHCYEDQFRPYQGEDLRRVVEESRANFSRVIDHLPGRLTYVEGGEEKPGSVILAGGEILLDAVRESVLYPALDQLRRKYDSAGGVKLIVQTTGDTLSARITRELLDHGVWLISVSGMDAFHEGLDVEGTEARVRTMMNANGVEFLDLVAGDSRNASPSGRYYHFFGATPESWIGRLWPRGRAWTNELTTATLEDNFCNRWSGGLGFLNRRDKGSEVSIDPAGNVFPCCLKTRVPVGNLLSESLDEILDRCAASPVYQAINRGQPERMGEANGWSVETFLEKSRTTLPSGRAYQNLCIGCDRFHEEVLTQLVTLAPSRG